MTDGEQVVRHFRFANVHALARDYSDERLRTVLREGGPAEVVEFASLVLDARGGDESARELMEGILRESPQFGGPR